MREWTSDCVRMVAVAVLSGFVGMTGVVQAEKPAWAGGGDGQHGKRERGQGGSQGGDGDKGHMRDSDRGRGGVSVRFVDHQRTRVREYFTREVGAGRCPPGLAKKGNGCMPPGQAKKWAVGRPLPRDVAYYDLPPSLVVELGVPPEGHRFVRVATDILMIAVGTGLVVDAIEDLGR